MNEEIINAVINAIGAIAEISATYFKTLVKNGISESAALEMSIAFVTKFTELSFGQRQSFDDEDD